MKKKVGIMSMQRIINYGSYLQAYALFNTIKDLGHQVEFVDFKIDPCIDSPYTPLKIDDIQPEYQNGFLKVKRFNQKFSEQYLKEIKVSQRNERPLLDTLIIGSDEVFNCLQNNPNVGYSLELFGKNNQAQKVISYAASFGHTTLERLKKANKEREIAELLNQFYKISIRDTNSQKVIHALSKKQVFQHLDPVLIYNFSNDLKEVDIPFQDYIIVYAYSFNLTDTECFAIQRFAQKHHKKIVTIGSYQKCTDIYVEAHPLEILNYFKKADLVITNTFHGTIFSIKTHTPFITGIRPKYNNEKLMDLLERLNFTNRKTDSFQDLDILYERNINFQSCDQFLAKEKNRSLAYLKENI